MAKIWNITGTPGSKKAPTTMVVLGRPIPPGKCIKVPDEELTGANKTVKDVENGYIFIGEALPGLAVARVELAKDTPRAHGSVEAKSTPVTVEAPKEEEVEEPKVARTSRRR